MAPRGQLDATASRAAPGCADPEGDPWVTLRVTSSSAFPRKRERLDPTSGSYNSCPAQAICRTDQAWTARATLPTPASFVACRFSPYDRPVPTITISTVTEDDLPDLLPLIRGYLDFYGATPA